MSCFLSFHYKMFLLISIYNVYPPIEEAKDKTNTNKTASDSTIFDTPQIKRTTKGIVFKFSLSEDRWHRF